MGGDPLTIRNCSNVPLELKLVERFDPHEGGGFSVSAVHGHFKALTNSVGLTNNTTRSAVPQIDSNSQPYTTQDVSIRIEPFSSFKTDITPFDRSDKDRLRLSFDTDNGRHQMYCPVPTAESGSLQSLDPNSRYRFTGIFLPQAAHITLYSSSHPARWMEPLRNETPLSALSIPGTHNSPTCNLAPPSVRCQAVSPREQLLNGVRFFDLRIQVPADNRDASSNKLVLVHSVFPIALTGNKYFRDLYAEIKTFLSENPSETLIVSLKREGTGDGTDEEFARIIKTHYVDADASIWFTEPRVPSLGESRGKIVLMRRFNAGEIPDFGIDAAAWADNTPCATCPSGDVCIQDFYEVMETENIEKKIEYCNAHLERSGCCVFTEERFRECVERGEKMPLYVNFLSASNFWKVGTWPEKIAAKVNPSVVDWLCRRHMVNDDGGAKEGDWSTGIVVCDWVGLDGDWDLVRCIVGMNAKLLR